MLRDVISEIFGAIDWGRGKEIEDGSDFISLCKTAALNQRKWLMDEWMDHNLMARDDLSKLGVSEERVTSFMEP